MKFSKKKASEKIDVKDPSVGNWRNKMSAKYYDQPERSKQEDLIRYKLCCPQCKFEWQQDIDMMDETDGISPCLKCGYN